MGALVWVVGCDDPHELLTEARQVVVAAEALGTTALTGDPILAGSALCLELTRVRDSDALESFVSAEHEDIAACYELSAASSVEQDGWCLTLDDVGPATLDLLRTDCSLGASLGESFGDDRIELEVVELADVRGGFEAATSQRRLYERLGRLFGVEPELELSAEDIPGVVAPPGEPLYVVEGESERVRAGLFLASDGRRVAVTEPWASGGATVGAPIVTRTDNPTFSLEYDAVAGEAFSVSLSVPGGVVAVGDVFVVAASSIATLDLRPEIVRIAGTDDFLSIGAVAIARDAQQRVLRHPPVQWSFVEGQGSLGSFDFDDDGQADPRPYAGLSDVCEGASAGEQRHAVLEGRVNGLVETVEVTWQCHDAEEVEDAGCGCRSSATPAGGWRLLVLLGLARVRTRRGRWSWACRSSPRPRRGRRRPTRSP